MPPLLLGLDIEPMEAKSVETLPAGDNWQFAPKWDGVPQRAAQQRRLASCAIAVELGAYCVFFSGPPVAAFSDNLPLAP
jgi:hypothetical protein